MTVQQIRTCIAVMRSVPHDPEQQHCIKDSLYIDVLRDIAKGLEDNHADAPAWEQAMEALKAEEVPVKWSACA